MVQLQEVQRLVFGTGVLLNDLGRKEDIVKFSIQIVQSYDGVRQSWVRQEISGVDHQAQKIKDSRGLAHPSLAVIYDDASAKIGQTDSAPAIHWFSEFFEPSLYGMRRVHE